MPWLQPPFEQILSEVRANRLAHALLVQGEPGIGIAYLSDALCNFRLCHQTLEEACGQCKSCQLLRAGSHPDIMVLEPTGAGEVIKVDQVREAVGFLSQTPQIGEWKIVKVANAHRLNINAANALLKILEEPPGNSLLVLTTDRPQLLIPTIRSRCRKRDVLAPNEQQVKTYCRENDVSEAEVTSLIPVLGLKPLKICEWVKEGNYALWQTLQDGLAKLSDSQTTVRELTESLSDQKVSEVLEWLMITASVETKRTSAERARIRWLQIYEWLVKARNEVDRGTNPNRQLLLDECFLRWKSATVES